MWQAPKVTPRANAYRLAVRYAGTGKEIKFGKVELTNSHYQEHVVGVNAYLAGVDEDSGRSGRSKLARRGEARIAPWHWELPPPIMN